MYISCCNCSHLTKIFTEDEKLFRFGCDAGEDKFEFHVIHFDDTYKNRKFKLCEKMKFCKYYERKKKSK